MYSCISYPEIITHVFSSIRDVHKSIKTERCWTAFLESVIAPMVHCHFPTYSQVACSRESWTLSFLPWNSYNAILVCASRVPWSSSIRGRGGGCHQQHMLPVARCPTLHYRVVFTWTHIGLTFYCTGLMWLHSVVSSLELKQNILVGCAELAVVNSLATFPPCQGLCDGLFITVCHAVAAANNLYLKIAWHCFSMSLRYRQIACS